MGKLVRLERIATSTSPTWRWLQVRSCFWPVLQPPSGTSKVVVMNASCKPSLQKCVSVQHYHYYYYYIYMHITWCIQCIYVYFIRICIYIYTHVYCDVLRSLCVWDHVESIFVFKARTHTQSHTHIYIYMYFVYIHNYLYGTLCVYIYKIYR